MPIGGPEYETNQWDGLGKGKTPTKAATTPAPKTATTVVKPVAVKKPVATAKKPDQFMAAINGFLNQLRAMLGIRGRML